MYKMILSDLDETLLVDHHIPKENLKAIQKVRERGVQFVICTGRSYEIVQDIVSELGMTNMKDTYSICLNGGLIVENHQQKILRFQNLDADIAIELIKHGLNLEVCLMVFTLDCCYFIHPSDEEVERKQIQKATYKILSEDEIDQLKGQKIAKVLYALPNIERLREIASDIPSELMEKVSTTFSSYRYLEFNAPGVNKGVGLNFLADYLNIDVQDVIAIGDNDNDIEMIKEAGLGVCVQGASEHIKAHADYITQNDYDGFAVAELIDHLINEGQL